MSDLAYVFNQRKNNLGVWEPVYVTETITVSSTQPYIVQLSERPSNGIDVPRTTPPSVVDPDASNGVPLFVATTNGSAISEYEYYVNYESGVITFNAIQSGNTLEISYYKLGTVVSADDINELIKRIVHMDADPTTDDSDYEIGTIWVTTTTTNLGTSRQLWLLSDIITGGDAIWVPFGNGLSVVNSSGEKTSVEVYPDGRILFTVLDEIAGFFNCEKNFYITNFIDSSGFVKNDTNGMLSGGHQITLEELGLVAEAPIHFDSSHIGHDITPGAIHLPSGGVAGQYLECVGDGSGRWVDTSINDYIGTEPINISGLSITHSTTPGYKHIPSGGTTGQALIWSANGTAVWATLASGTIYNTTLPITLTDNITFGHSSDPGYKHVPSGGATGQFLYYGGASGTATWKSINTDETMAADSNTEVPSQAAVKGYVDALMVNAGNWTRTTLDYSGTTYNVVTPTIAGDSVFIKNSIFIKANAYSGTNAGFRIYHNASGSTDSGIGFMLNNYSFLTADSTKITLANPTKLNYTLEVAGASTLSSTLSVIGNISKINNVSYVWPSSRASISPALLVSTGSGGTLSWNVISTDTSMGDVTPSDLIISSQKAVKAYIDAKYSAIPQLWTRSGITISTMTSGDTLSLGGQLYVTNWTSAGIVKNNAAGLLSGGNKILIGDMTSNLFKGTARRITITTDASSYTFSAPQDIDTSSDTQFKTVTAGGLTNANNALGFIYNPSTTSPLPLIGSVKSAFSISADMTGSDLIYGVYLKKIKSHDYYYGNNWAIATGMHIEGVGMDGSGHTAYGIRVGQVGGATLTNAYGLVIGPVYNNTNQTGQCVGLQILDVSGVTSALGEPLAINTKRGNIEFEKCGHIRVSSDEIGPTTFVNTPGRLTSVGKDSYISINTDDTSATSTFGIEFKRGGKTRWELRNTRHTYQLGAYVDSVNTELYGDDLALYNYLDDGSSQVFYGSPVMRFTRNGGLNFYQGLTTFQSRIEIMSKHMYLDDVLKIDSTTKQPGSFTTNNSGNNYWTTLGGASVTVNIADAPSFDPTMGLTSDYTGMDHYLSKCCNVTHSDLSGFVGQYYEIPNFYFKPGVFYTISFRYKMTYTLQAPITENRLNSLRIGNSSGGWIDLLQDPDGTNWAWRSPNGVWETKTLNIQIPVCTPMETYNRFFIGENNTTQTYSANYRLTWIDIRECYNPESGTGNLAVSNDLGVGGGIRMANCYLAPIPRDTLTPYPTAASDPGSPGEIRFDTINGIIYMKLLGNSVDDGVTPGDWVKFVHTDL